ncbi:MAG: tRNA dihydrouridine synthase DusB [Ignavibacteriae bacterium]|nr:MAG: tRNA dihydrouridine synthase DusB [Ignavibacteriota bacterium]
MFKIDKIELKDPLFLAPMEDVTGIAFRKLCKELGADIVYTEFVNSDGLIRDNKKTHQKLRITEEERPVGIQIYGGNIDAMREAAIIAEKENPEIIDINAGCWVKKVANRGAGAGLLKDPPYMQKMVKEIVNAVKLPVTVKTRLGWDDDNIQILEVAKRLEDVGVRALTIHCRTRKQGHSGEPAWHWIPQIKDVVKIPVVVNGGIMTAEDALKAKKITNADGYMIARGAINHPWIFREIKEIFEKGYISNLIDINERINTCLLHLKYEIKHKDEPRRAIIPFRKYYSGYLKGLYGASKIKQKIMQYEEYEPIENLLLNYLAQLKEYQEIDE